MDLTAQSSIEVRNHYQELEAVPDDLCVQKEGYVQYTWKIVAQNMHEQKSAFLSVYFEFESKTESRRLSDKHPTR